VEKYGRARQATDDNIIRRMRFACWVIKATDTRSEYVVLITFVRQQRLSERASVLRYTHSVSCLTRRMLMTIHCRKLENCLCIMQRLGRLMPQLLETLCCKF
jgi:plasmid rolling circle replication initiator protein Rep